MVLPFLFEGRYGYNCIRPMEKYDMSKRTNGCRLDKKEGNMINKKQKARTEPTPASEKVLKGLICY
jgi:hypothetical protein